MSIKTRVVAAASAVAITGSLALASPASAVFNNRTIAPKAAGESGAKIVLNYKLGGSFPTPSKVLVQRQASDFFENLDVDQATLSVKCRTDKLAKGFAIFRNTIRPGDTRQDIVWGDNRKNLCDEVTSVFIRTEFGDVDGDGDVDADDKAAAIDLLENPSFPDNRPLRITLNTLDA